MPNQQYLKSEDMIKLINYVEKEIHGITHMYATRVNFFQEQDLTVMEGVEYDTTFEEFVKELENVVGDVYRPTAKKILNNWYVWAKDNYNAVKNIQPFKQSSNAIDWLIVNNFRIDHAVFAKSATPEMIEYVKQEMPKNSELAKIMKNAADIQYPGPRGFTYDYLVKVVAGFISDWN